MLKTYAFLFGMGYLLLTGCGREQSAREQVSAPTGQAAIDTAGRAALPVAPVPPPDSAFVPAVAGRMAIATPGHIKRGATSFADVQEEDPTETVASTPADSVGTAELRKFLASGLPAAQSFTIHPSRDTMIIGPQGTQLLLPADAWALPDSSAVVRLEMQEFYTPADMILAGLSTTAGPQLLETGGMLRLTATANGRPVRLRPGRYVHLRMPARKAKPGMQLFEGVVHGHDQRVDWQLSSAAHGPTAARPVAKGRKALPARVTGPARLIDSTSIMRPEPRWPQYPQFNQKLQAQFKSLDNSPRRLRRNRNNSPRTTNALNRLSESYDQRIVRSVSVGFTIDSTGTLGKIALHPGSDPQLAATASAALLKMDRWKPAELPLYVKGKMQFERTVAVNTVQLDFTKSGKIFISQQRWSVARACKPRAKRLKQELDSLLTDKRFRAHFRHDMDSLVDLQIAKQRAEAAAELARLRTQFTDTSRAAITQAGVYNELSSQGLSWINCDRFVGPMPRIALKVPSPGGSAITSLVFRDMNSVMRGEQDNGSKVIFKEVPLGKSATLVALRREKGITYLATHNTIIGPLAVGSFNFHPVTIAELRAELASLQ